MRYMYYEEGYPRKMSLRKIHRCFRIYVNDTQKQQGTTFSTWMAEMLKMQIFVPAGKEGAGC